MGRRRLAFVLLWQIVAVQGLVRERWHYYVPKCHIPGPQPIIPREWGQEWSSCNGAKQSPVLLLSHKSIGVAVPPLRFQHFSTPLANPVVYNTGRTLRVRASMPKPIVTGGLLTEEYVFDQAEFHWGRDDHSGSEHIVDALSYAVEVQMTFRLRTPAARVDCRECPPAYVGLATQLKTVRQVNPLLRTLVSSLSSVSYALERTDLDLPLRLIAFLPNDTRNYYMYEGSRTGAALHRERALDRLPGARLHRQGPGKDAPAAVRVSGGVHLQQAPGGQPETPAGDWPNQDALQNIQCRSFEATAEHHRSAGVHTAILQKHN
ncbi:hypothetical protein MTO96_009220 [Rhipicephalus appendiculatus]